MICFTLENVTFLDLDHAHNENDD